MTTILLIVLILAFAILLVDVRLRSFYDEGEYPGLIRAYLSRDSMRMILYLEE